jgi:hypothetical protein
MSRTTPNPEDRLARYRPTLDDAIAVVPNGEADHFPDQSIDWVLFTAIDASEHVVDAGGGLI